MTLPDISDILAPQKEYAKALEEAAPFHKKVEETRIKALGVGQKVFDAYQAAKVTREECDHPNIIRYNDGNQERLCGYCNTRIER
ncbi:hypothetical protein HOA91_02835 [Candidatus Woesearchaeota archaeon]|jgi:hypothetical protein|nr:hypothetical protein [Candidatus Woesearchaeota archaeon]